MIQSVVRKNPAFWSFDFIGAIINIFLKILMRVLRFSIKYFSQFAEKAPTQKNKFDKDFLRLMCEKVCIYHCLGLPLSYNTFRQIPLTTILILRLENF